MGSADWRHRRAHQGCRPARVGRLATDEDDRAGVRAGRRAGGVRDAGGPAGSRPPLGDSNALAGGSAAGSPRRPVVRRPHHQFRGSSRRACAADRAHDGWPPMAAASRGRPGRGPRGGFHARAPQAVRARCMGHGVRSRPRRHRARRAFERPLRSARRGRRGAVHTLLHSGSLFGARHGDWSFRPGPGRRVCRRPPARRRSVWTGRRRRQSTRHQRHDATVRSGARPRCDRGRWPGGRRRHGEGRRGRTIGGGNRRRRRRTLPGPERFVSTTSSSVRRSTIGA